MIGIGRQTDYAARIVLHLACLEPGAMVSVREIAEQRLLPAPFVRRLVGRLVTAGILRSARGFQGGVTLARSAGEVSMLDVVLAMEGSLTLNVCVDHHDACPFSGSCPVHVAWCGVTEGLHRNLAAIRFDQLALGTTGHTEAHRATRAVAPRVRSTPKPKPKPKP